MTRHAILSFANAEAEPTADWTLCASQMCVRAQHTHTHCAHPRSMIQCETQNCFLMCSSTITISFAIAGQLDQSDRIVSLWFVFNVPARSMRQIRTKWFWFWLKHWVASPGWCSRPVRQPGSTCRQQRHPSHCRSPILRGQAISIYGILI